jgi:hypothetical protein
VEAHWTEATVGKNGEVTLNGLPFSPGESVEVLVVAKTPASAGKHKSLLGSVIEYRDPFEPVAADDWESMR